MLKEIGIEVGKLLKVMLANYSFLEGRMVAQIQVAYDYTMTEFSMMQTKNKSCPYLRYDIRKNDGVWPCCWSQKFYFYQTWPFSANWQNPNVFILLNVINLFIYLSLPNLYFYTIRSLTMFLKVLNKVNFKVCTKPKLLLIIDLLPFSKLLKLLAINHCLSEGRDIFLFLGC